MAWAWISGRVRIWARACDYGTADSLLDVWRGAYGVSIDTGGYTSPSREARLFRI